MLRTESAIKVESEASYTPDAPVKVGPRKQLEGTAISLKVSDVDTDQIIPARFMKGVSFDGLGRHVFADVRATFRERGHIHPFDDPACRGATFLFVDSNFGCGSSREHAGQALRRWGISAIVGASFGEIFAGNCVAIGLPCLQVNEEGLGLLHDAAKTNPSRHFEINLEAGTIQSGNLVVPFELREGVRRQFIEGTWDATAVLLQSADAIERTAARLPYLNGWR